MMRLLRSVMMCALLCNGSSEAATSSVNGPSSPPPPPGGKSLQPRLEAVSVDGLKSRQRRYFDTSRIKALPPKGIPAGTPDLALVGEIDGSWDTVDAYLTFPYFFSDPGFEAQVLLRGFDVSTSVNGNQYRVDGWDRTVYWLDFDVADPGKVPRLLATLELANHYQPQSGDGFPEFLADAAVVSACAAADCTINWVPYVFLREAGRDYMAYPDQAADASMYFVADVNGDAVSALLDINDANGNFERTDSLVAGDELELFTIAYRMSEPGFVYTVRVMNFEVMDAGLAIQRRHYVPGQDFQDADLVADLNAAQRPIRLLLDAHRTSPAEFQFGGPFALGFQWGNVPNFVHASSFESLAPIPVASSLVKRRRMSPAIPVSPSGGQ